MKTSISIGILLILQAVGVIAEIVPPQVDSCSACHGVNGVSSNPDWPSLAGQKKGYLETQLKKFRDGQRSNPLMTSVVKGMSNSDIAKVAGYYSDKPPKAASNGNVTLIDTGENLSAYCKACHGMTGKTANSEWPNLAGQQAAYLEQQLVLFKSGQRENAQMTIALNGLKKADFSALAAYYSQLKP